MSHHPLTDILMTLAGQLAARRTAGARPVTTHDLAAWEAQLRRLAAALDDVLMASTRPQVLSMTSGVSHRTRRGFVQLTWGDYRGQLDVAEAREHAFQLLNAAESAQFDSLFLQWLTSRKLVASPEEGASLLVEFRHLREAQESESSRHDQPFNSDEEEN